jgi:hypothetical protein
MHVTPGQRTCVRYSLPWWRWIRGAPRCRTPIGTLDVTLAMQEDLIDRTVGEVHRIAALLMACAGERCATSGSTNRPSRGQSRGRAFAKDHVRRPDSAKPRSARGWKRACRGAVILRCVVALLPRSGDRVALQAVLPRIERVGGPSAHHCAWPSLGGADVPSADGRGGGVGRYGSLRRNRQPARRAPATPCRLAEAGGRDGQIVAAAAASTARTLSCHDVYRLLTGFGESFCVMFSWSGMLPWRRSCAISAGSLD